jgi:hypothetical protein
MAVLVSAIILIRQIRWLAIVVLLITAGYLAHGYLSDLGFEERWDHVTILRP